MLKQRKKNFFESKIKAILKKKKTLKELKQEKLICWNKLAIFLGDDWPQSLKEVWKIILLNKWVVLSDNLLFLKMM